MKVISHGVFDKKGIRIKCQACGCEYLIENRNDFDVNKKLVDYYPRRYAAEYTTYCPECSYPRYFGMDPDIAQTGNVKEYASIFDRPDWIERYEVLYEENN